jgi:hypothetical protein
MQHSHEFAVTFLSKQQAEDAARRINLAATRLQGLDALNATSPLVMRVDPPRLVVDLTLDPSLQEGTTSPRKADAPSDGGDVDEALDVLRGSMCEWKQSMLLLGVLRADVQSIVEHILSLPPHARGVFGDAVRRRVCVAVAEKRIEVAVHAVPPAVAARAPIDIPRPPTGSKDASA